MTNCATPVIHVWCFSWITCVKHVYYTCICYRCITLLFLYICNVQYTPVLHMYFYRCICRLYNCIIHLYNMCETSILLQIFYTYYRHMNYMCNTPKYHTCVIHQNTIHVRPQNTIHVADTCNTLVAPLLGLNFSRHPSTDSTS